MPPATYEAAEWQFPTVADQRRYRAVVDHLDAYFAGATNSDVQRAGNFLRRDWQRGADHASLSVLHAPARYPEVFGLALDAHVAQEGVVLDLHLAVDGGTIVGDALTLDARTPDGALTLTTVPTYEVLADTIPGPVLPPIAFAEALTASPESFRGVVAAWTLALADPVRDHLDSGAVRVCEYGPAPVGGGAPLCTYVPASPEQVASERARLAAWEQRYASIGAAHGARVQGMLRELLPLELREAAR